MSVSYESMVTQLSKIQHKERVKERIEIHILQSHCYDSVHETVILTLPIDESGEKLLNLFIQMFPEVSRMTEINRGISTDEIAEKIVKKFNTDRDVTFNLLNNFIRTDAAHDDFGFVAHPQSYKIKVFDSLGFSTAFVSQC